MEVDENLAHRVEVVRHRRAHHVVGLLGQHFAHRPRAHRHSDNDRVGAGGPQRSHRGEERTGLSIFRPTDGLDEGPVILQKETPISPDDTLGSVYFDRLFPMGVDALLEAAELVVSGTAVPVTQDESQASYLGWCRAAEAAINWHNHIDLVYNLIRGCNPAPGAWTTHEGKKLQVFDARKHAARSYSQVKGKIGAVTAIEGSSAWVSVQGGQIELIRVRYEDGKKIPAAQFCAEAGLKVGAIMGA